MLPSSPSLKKRQTSSYVPRCAPGKWRNPQQLFSQLASPAPRDEGNTALCLAGLDLLPRLALLMCGEFRLAAEFDAPRKARFITGIGVANVYGSCGTGSDLDIGPICGRSPAEPLAAVQRAERDGAGR